MLSQIQKNRLFKFIQHFNFFYVEVYRLLDSKKSLLNKSEQLQQQLFAYRKIISDKTALLIIPSLVIDDFNRIS